MESGEATELVLLRHAPAMTGGRLCGRTDVDADLGDDARIAAVRASVGTPARLLCSPARRCLQTAAALWPGMTPRTEAALWEQDFGSWEALPLRDLPDLGPLTGAALADHRPPGGESFADLCMRVAPALRAAAGSAGAVVIVAHAGTIRAALAMALGAPAAGLAFEIAPLSVTRLRAVGTGWAVGAVNWVPA